MSNIAHHNNCTPWSSLVIWMHSNNKKFKDNRHESNICFPAFKQFYMNVRMISNGEGLTKNIIKVYRNLFFKINYTFENLCMTILTELQNTCSPNFIDFISSWNFLVIKVLDSWVNEWCFLDSLDIMSSIKHFMEQTWSNSRHGIHPLETM